MIIGIGTDIVEISRIAKLLEKNEDIFLNRVFSKREIAQAPTIPLRRAEYFAGRWAAREAAAKALGCGFCSDCTAYDFEIIGNEAGAPCLTGSSSLIPRGAVWHLSISHDGGFAIAFVILEKN